MDEAGSERTWEFTPIVRDRLGPTIEQVTRAAKANPALTVSLMIGVAFVLKLWVVANGSMTTALVLMQSSSAQTVVSGIVVVAIPIVALWAVILINNSFTTWGTSKCSVADQRW